MAEKTVAAPGRGADGSQQETTRERERYVAPPVDIYETPDGLTVLADLPGVGKDGLDIQVKDDLLTIVARAENGQRGEPIYREFQLVNYQRQFQLHDAVDAARISAEFKHGVLTLRLPKAEEAKPKKIEVKVS